jgi:hypothetical protein
MHEEAMLSKPTATKPMQRFIGG